MKMEAKEEKFLNSSVPETCSGHKKTAEVSKDELFRRLRLCASYHIDRPLKGLSEAADLAEKYYRKYYEFFWNVPPRDCIDEAAFVGNAINRLKKGSLRTVPLALEIIELLERKNA
jgi:hypothetical protein